MQIFRYQSTFELQCSMPTFSVFAVIPVLWLSFVCERGVGEVGHLVGDLGVLLCPFPLGNKSCPVKWNKSNKSIVLFHETCKYVIKGIVMVSIIAIYFRIFYFCSLAFLTFLRAQGISLSFFSAF